MARQSIDALVSDDRVADRTRPWLMRTDWLGAAEVGAVVRIRAQRWTRYGLGLVVVRQPSTLRVGQSDVD